MKFLEICFMKYWSSKIRAVETCWKSLRIVLELFFTLFFKRKINKMQSGFLISLRKTSAIPLSFSAFPVYVGNRVEVLWRQKTFWNVEKNVSCKSSKLLQDFKIRTLRGASYFFSEAWGWPLNTIWVVKLPNLLEETTEWQNTCGSVQVSVFAWTYRYRMLTGSSM